MVSTELGSCEWFVWDLRRSNLIDRGRLDQVVGEYLARNPRAEPSALAEYLVEKGVLTAFQAERLLQGKTQGFVLGPFTLMDALGAGSMGTVYKAQSKTDNQWYAVKVLPRRSMWNVRIARRKVRQFEQARHATVVPFVDVGTAGGMHYLAWPFVEGEPLDRWIQARGKVAPHEAVAVAQQVAEGLDVCHQQGLIHGLLKPSNLLIGADLQVYILDFGIGCLLAETEGESLVDTMSTANSVTSGLDCASPESIMDPTNLTPAGDQYSLGCVLYTMLTGQYPFPDGNAADKMMAHQFKEPTPLQQLNPDVPAELAAVVQKLMQKSPEQRYSNAQEVIEALRPFVRKASPPDLRSSPGTRSTAGLRSTLASRPTTMPATSAPAPAAPPALTPSPYRNSLAGSSSSTSTPRPQATLGALPTRSTLRASTQHAMRAPAAPPPAPEPAPEPEPDETAPPQAQSRVIPGGAADDSGAEEKLGPVGFVIVTLFICSILYAAAVVFKLF